MLVRMSDVNEMALKLGDEYLQDVLRAGDLTSDGQMLEMAVDQFNAIRSKWNPAAPLVRAGRYGVAVAAAAVMDPVSDDVRAVREGSCRSCRHFLESRAVPGKHYCGLCGCGDKSKAILEDKKWAMPVVNCPLGRPGFTNAEGGDE